ncbi:hypothetical protein [Paracoccus aestuariivivens]|uniref:hypothetical protein n=1 Tax=Paracoccus aestuariivivens TaxID=1820333 RepID=UPI001B8B0A03|nr:hypothetical protein [Paracoccus aestuariivivens]
MNATCPTGIEIHADEHGPIYFNGNDAKITSQNDNYVEATHGHVTVSLMINPDNTVEVSYTGPNRANGICQVGHANTGHKHKPATCPPDVSEADRYKYPACN